MANIGNCSSDLILKIINLKVTFNFRFTINYLLQTEKLLITSVYKSILSSVHFLQPKLIQIEREEVVVLTIL